MPWNSTTKIMTAPINTNIGGDLQKALNTRYNGDLGHTIYLAAQNKRINKWAKYKPIIHTATGYITDAQRIAANQGFHVNTSATLANPDNDSLYQTSAQLCYNAAAANNCDWIYDKPPTGTIGTSPYRLFDLLHIESNLSKISSHNGYNKLAETPFEFVSIGPEDTEQVAGSLKCACSFYYKIDDLALTDFQIYNSILPTHDWYYCLIASIGGNITVIPLMTSSGGSTKLAVETPSDTMKHGYFVLNNQQTQGPISAYLAIYAVNKATSDSNSHFIYLPTGRSAYFDPTSGQAGIVTKFGFSWTSDQNTYQPGTQVKGLRIGWAFDQNTGFTWLSEVHLRITIGIPSDFNTSSMSSIIVRIKPKIVPIVNGDERGAWQGEEQQIEIFRNNIPANNMAFLTFDIANAPLKLESEDDLENVKISLLVSVGAESFYVFPVHEVGQGMPHGTSNTETFATVSQIKTQLGSDESHYVDIYNVNLA